VFFANFSIKSQKEKNAIVVIPRDITSFVEDLKVLVDLGYEGSFKLTQNKEMDGTIKKYINITGMSPDGKDVIKSFVEIDPVFQRDQYPEDIEPK